MTPERLHALAPGVEAIVADPTVNVGKQLLDAAGPQLRVVANFAVGLDNLDLDECRRREVIVTNTPDVLTDATAELALSLTLAAARRTTEAEAYTSRTRKAGAERAFSAVRVELEELLGRGDVVSLHLSTTPGTVGLIGRRELDAMKPDAILVNTARGSLVDASALAQALHEGAIGAAGLDVYKHEPYVPDELLRAPHCVLLPHIGSATTRARGAMARLVADNVLAALRDDEPPNRVA